MISWIYLVMKHLEWYQSTALRGSCFTDCGLAKGFRSSRVTISMVLCTSMYVYNYTLIWKAYCVTFFKRMFSCQKPVHWISYTWKDIYRKYICMKETDSTSMYKHFLYVLAYICTSVYMHFHATFDWKNIYNFNPLAMPLY